MRRWVFFFGLELFSHIFIDAFNTYGTGWFEPFHHYRVSFNVLFVADPLYSVCVGDGGAHAGGAAAEQCGAAAVGVDGTGAQHRLSMLWSLQ